MATLLYTIVGISLHCAVRREISPCTCSPLHPNKIQVTCEQMQSFSQIVDVLQDRFNPDLNIWLKISYSQLQDLDARTFAEMNMKVKNLRMNFDNLGKLPESAFRNLTQTEYLSLADNALEEIPAGVFKNMHNIGTLDIARCKIKEIKTDDFKSLTALRHLVVASNQISRIEKDAFPPTMMNLHIGKNNLTSLNGTLRNLYQMKLLFINGNNLKTLDNELPVGSEYLMMILAQSNQLEALPADMKTFPKLDSVYVHHNKLKSLDRVFQNARYLMKLFAYNNDIEYLAPNEFEHAEMIDELQLGYNSIKSLNNSLLPIKHLRIANFTQNLLTEFSLSEIRGLEKLRKLELSYNQIEKLVGYGENLIEPISSLVELRLEHNLLESLDGRLMGLAKLRNLYVAHNRLKVLLPGDLNGMEELVVLDLSYNQLTTLADTATSYLPSLETLNVSYNLLTELKNDFHGLPILCTADLSNNNISFISKDLVANTRCSNHGVPNKLEILLKENPILCNENVSQLVAEMEQQQARILGIAHCIIPKELSVDPVPPILLPPLPPRPQLIPSNIQIPAAILPPAPSVVQVLVPANQIIPGIALVPSNVMITTTTVPEAVTEITESPLNPTALEVKSTTELIVSDPITTTSTTPQPTTTRNQVIHSTPASVIPEPMPPRGHLPMSFRLKYSADDEKSAEDEMNGVDSKLKLTVPEVIMPLSDNSQMKLVMEPEEEPPELLQDQEAQPID